MHVFFFFNDTATTEIYTLSLHDALPIYELNAEPRRGRRYLRDAARMIDPIEQFNIEKIFTMLRSEEHTSELQSHLNLVCRLLLEKKKHMPSGSDWFGRISYAFRT